MGYEFPGWMHCDDSYKEGIAAVYNVLKKYDDVVSQLNILQTTHNADVRRLEQMITDNVANLNRSIQQIAQRQNAVEASQNAVQLAFNQLSAKVNDFMQNVPAMISNAVDAAKIELRAEFNINLQGEISRLHTTLYNIIKKNDNASIKRDQDLIKDISRLEIMHHSDISNLSDRIDDIASDGSAEIKGVKALIDTLTNQINDIKAWQDKSPGYVYSIITGKKLSVQELFDQYYKYLRTDGSLTAGEISASDIRVHDTDNTIIGEVSTNNGKWLRYNVSNPVTGKVRTLSNALSSVAKSNVAITNNDIVDADIKYGTPPDKKMDYNDWRHNGFYLIGSLVRKIHDYGNRKIYNITVNYKIAADQHEFAFDAPISIIDILSVYTMSGSNPRIEANAKLSVNDQEIIITLNPDDINIDTTYTTSMIVVGKKVGE